MNKEILDDDLEAEYDLTKMRIRRVGEGRKILSQNAIILDVDNAKVFPDSASVNEALRFLVRITRENKSQIELSK